MKTQLVIAKYIHAWYTPPQIFIVNILHWTSINKEIWKVFLKQIQLVFFLIVIKLKSVHWMERYKLLSMSEEGLCGRHIVWKKFYCANRHFQEKFQQKSVDLIIKFLFWFCIIQKWVFVLFNSSSIIITLQCCLIYW